MGHATPYYIKDKSTKVEFDSSSEILHFITQHLALRQRLRMDFIIHTDLYFEVAAI